MKRILVVDDFKESADVRKLVINEYTEHAFEIETLYDGKACLERLAQRPPIDLLLLDIDMPGISGADIIQEILKMEPRPSFKIIPNTAWGSDWPKRWGMEELSKKPEYLDLVLPTVDKADDEIGALVRRICGILKVPIPQHLKE